MKPAAKNCNQPFAAWIALMSAVFVTTSIAGETSDPGDSSKRPAWTTSRVFGTPEPPPPYTTERAFTSLKFDKCLELVTAPGSNRLFVVEQNGKVYSFPDRDDVDQADLVIDFAKANPEIKQVYSLAFHPDFRQNRYCYVCYIKANDQPDGTQVSRFVMSDSEAPTIDFATETPLLSWLSGGHNGCCLRFGPDGYLYISTGDGGPANPPDPLQTGQNLDDFLSVVLRIDVDQAELGRNYRIPADNPFVDVEGARGEIWAYGLRNPWRISFDQKTGDFWVGDVGWEAWEMLYRVDKGGNYGWAVVEGPQSVNPQWQRGPTPILPPTVQLPHSESSSITEGFTYYGTRLPELDGTHIYGDYDTGKIWGFRFEDGNVVDHRPIAATSHRIVSFGENTRGDALVVDHIAGTLHRLVPQTAPASDHPFPRRLSETGLFTSTAESTAAPGVVAYEVNASMWSDFAVADRWVAVPEQQTIQPRNDWAMWTFPKDSVLVKTLSMEMRRGDPNSLRRIETQILHFDGSNWMPYTYKWTDDQSDASLVDATGLDIELEVRDDIAPESLRKQVWRFAGRAECQRCHNRWSGPALAFNTPQFLTQHAKGSAAGDQIDNFVRFGLIESRPNVGDRKPLVDPYNTSDTLEDRARAYLHVNCAHCHRMHAGGSVLSFMHADLSLEKANMIGVRPTQGTFGIDGAKVIAPGDPFRSVLLYRMAKLGNGRMPHIGSFEVDVAGVDVLAQWIETLRIETQRVETLGVDQQQDEQKSVGSLSQQHAREIKSLLAKGDRDADPETRQQIQSLVAAPGGALRLVRLLHQKQLSPAVHAMAIETAMAQDDVGIRGLFEQFLPLDQRARRLGAVVQPDQILGLVGDASRGEKLFHATAGITCVNCHRIGQAGKEVGPDLTAIGKKLNRAQLLESILEPSKAIDPPFVTWLVVTDDGRVLTGMMMEKTDQRVSIKDAQGQVHRIAQASIEQLMAQQQSMMPELLTQDMTAQQLADLLDYLSSLR